MDALSPQAVVHVEILRQKSESDPRVEPMTALALPPRWFYGGRQWLGAQTWYKRARVSAVPVPRFAKIDVPKTETRSATSEK